MDLHAPFLAEICEHPEDDAPRLIYADWLEEQGDPRAGGIRWQVEAEHWPAWHPARSELLLQAELAGLPEPELPQLEQVVWHRPQRGFPGGAQVTDWPEFERAAAQVFRIAPISTLHLPFVRDVLQQAADSPCLRHIRELRILNRPNYRSPAQQVGDALAALLSSPVLSGLVRLELASLHESASDAVSRAAARLKSLTLDDILLVFPADVEELCLALEPAPLVSLTLDRNRLGDGIVQLANESLRGIESLAIRSNALSRLGAQALVNSTRLAGLKSLELDGNRVGVPGLAALTDGFAELEYLSLADNRLGTHAVQELALAHGLSKLRGLNLAQNTFGQDAFGPFTASRSLPRLEHLNLSLNALQLSGLKTLLTTPMAERLESLDLSCNPLGDEGAVLLASSPALANLKWLNLSAANISSAGALALANSPHLEGLRYLDLRQNALGSEGRETLEERFVRSRDQVFAAAC